MVKIVKKMDQQRSKGKEKGDKPEVHRIKRWRESQNRQNRAKMLQNPTSTIPNHLLLKLKMSKSQNVPNDRYGLKKYNQLL